MQSDGEASRNSAGFTPWNPAKRGRSHSTGPVPLETGRLKAAEAKNERSLMGFTLIEVTMVLAISSLLALILLGGYQETQKRERFRDSVERAVTLLEQVKGEANATVNTSGGGDNATRLVFAKAVVFTDGSSDIKVATLSASDSDILSGIREDDSRSVSLPWQVQFVADSSTHRAVVFTRSVISGELNTYVLNTDNITDRGQYVDTAAAATNAQATASVVLQDPFEGFLATININAETNEVTRTYDN